MNAAHRALARIRAAYGEQAVTRASLREAHLPEASFRWEPIQHARIGEHEGRPPISSMVRRVYARPKPLAPRVPREPEAGPFARERPRDRAHVRAVPRERRLVEAPGRTRLLLRRNRSRRPALALLRPPAEALVLTRSARLNERRTSRCGSRATTASWRAPPFPKSSSIAHTRLGSPRVAMTDRDGVYGLVRAQMRAKRARGMRVVTGAQLTVEVDGRCTARRRARQDASRLRAISVELLSLGHARCEKGMSRMVTRDELERSFDELFFLCSASPEVLARPTRESWPFVGVSRFVRASAERSRERPLEKALATRSARELAGSRR